MIAAYVDGRVEGPERAAIEAHLAGCEPCYTLFSEAARFRLEEKGGAKVVRPHFGRTWIALAAAACLVAAAVPLALRLRARHNVRPDVAELVAAVGPQRIIEGRLSGGFAYGPLRPTYRGANPENGQSLELIAAAGKIRKRAEEAPSPASLRADGAAELALGEWDRAVDSLFRASQLAPKDPGIKSDLAAAYLARARSLNRSEDYAKALETTEEAASLPAPPPEALFNRALALEMLNFRKEAISAWSAYLEVDSQSGWAAEVRRHLDALRNRPNSGRWLEVRPRLTGGAPSSNVEEIVSGFREQARTLAEDEILPTWGRAFLHGDLGGAKRSLDAAGSIGRALAAAKGERLLEDCVLEIERSDPDHRRHLAGAYSVFGDARSHYSHQEFSLALASFEASLKSFAASASPFRIRALEGMASCAYILHDWNKTAASLDEVGQTLALEHSGYVSAAGEKEWVLGLLEETRASNPEKSIDCFSRAVKDFEADDEAENASAVHRLLCSAFEDLGDSAGEWDHYRATLARLDDITSTYRNYQILSVATYVATNEHYYRLARLTSDRLISQASELRNDFELWEAHWHRGTIFLKIGRTRDALRDFEISDAIARRLPDTAVRNQSLALAELVRAPAIAEDDPQGALREIQDATRYWKATGDKLIYASTLLARGRVELAVGARVEAESDFSVALDELDRQRAEVPDESHAISFFDTARDALDEELRLFAEDNRAEDAFALAERMKARALLDRRRAISRKDAGGRVDPAILESAIPPGSAVIEFALLPDRLLAWGITSSRFFMTASRCTRPEVRGLVNEIRHEVAVPSGRSSSGAVPALSRLLLDELPREVLGAAQLVIVPDDCLNLVPFPALTDPLDGRRLIERHVITIEPSARFLVSNEASGPAGRRSGGVLVVGEPAYDIERFPGLPVLPAARDEARAIAGIYPGAWLLAGKEATIARFEELARKSSLVHFAGHAIPDPEKKVDTALLFAPDRNSSGILAGQQIENLALESHPLVVLSACATGGGEIHPSEGILSLARSFLEAGASAVVASLWPVDDRAASEVLVGFHRGLSSGHTPATALSEVERSLEKSHPAEYGNWAAFEFVGGTVAEEKEE